MFRPGDQILFRFVWPWKVFSAKGTTVIEHSQERVALWTAPGTPVKGPPGLRVPISRIAGGDWAHTDALWFGGRVMVAEFGASHSVYIQWAETGDFVGWYVNLEDPWRESPYGFDTTDHLLDIRVEPDRTWHWKDDDHLAEAVEVGLFSSEQAMDIRAEGERVIERIEAWTKPFDEGWEHWRPDLGWPLPPIPEGWDRI
ncbi:MAG TPA: DUF402 domain-containing protein [Gaiellaceae bacterium]